MTVLPVRPSLSIRDLEADAFSIFSSVTARPDVIIKFNILDTAQCQARLTRACSALYYPEVSSMPLNICIMSPCRARYFARETREGRAGYIRLWTPETGKCYSAILRRVSNLNSFDITHA